ncbi:hypothetical protein ACFWXK_39760 [Streptomyces sp. NPDC059070]|uniref:hypothetical protein n=1 Tax=Streptomyces sp. NPDC059070 TaxID=3346713 RepID=UPI0036B0196B
MRATRRTIRTAAIATGAIAALALPTGAAFAADATPGTAGQQEDTKDQRRDQQQERQKGEAKPDEAKPDDAKKDEKKPDEKKPDEKKPDERAREKKGDAKVLSTARVTMPDGRIAKLVKTTDGPRAVISMPNGNVLGSLDLKNPSTLNDGWTYKIVNAGKGFYKFVVVDGKHGGDSWVYDFNGKLIEKYTVDGRGKGHEKPATTTGTVPKGGVRAGAEGVSTGNQVPLIAAGGGMAAAGAAGLGFALYHRRGRQRG